MAQGRNTLMDPPIEDLLDKVDSKFTLVALGSARARQVNSYYNSLGEGLGKVVPPQVASVSGKPVSIAFEEIAAGKATYTRIDPEEDAVLAALEAEGAVDAADAGVIDDAEIAVEALLTEVKSDEDAGTFDLVAEQAEIEASSSDDAIDDTAEADIEVLDVGDEDPTAS
jgi:DNA-directed RNA polymerase subunit omega